MSRWSCLLPIRINVMLLIIGGENYPRINMKAQVCEGLDEITSSRM